MNDNILTSFNWLDVLMIIVIIGTVFRAVTQGFVAEVFKILGTLSATILALHFYRRLAVALHSGVMMPQKFGEILAFAGIWMATVVVFWLIREGWMLILKMEAKSGFSQGGGAILGIIRSFLICGLLFFFAYLPENQTLDTFADKSVSGAYLRDISAKVYKASFDRVIVKFLPDEPFNPWALKTVKIDPSGKHKKSL